MTAAPLPADLLDRLIDTGNKALNDHYHDDLCHCRQWPATCASSYFSGLWDTNAFAIALPAILAAYEEQRHAGPPHSADRDGEDRPV
ncbi:hypothetical protein [Kitasatospora griseola]|uniref:hypothetical protein n=1 Tax=Kitasatospora griseola TaxID=2064 RepID=UPI00341D50E8